MHRFFFCFLGGSNHINTEYVSPTSTQLGIYNAQPTDSGVYTCYVGAQESHINIIIEGEKCKKMGVISSANQIFIKDSSKFKLIITSFCTEVHSVCRIQ